MNILSFRSVLVALLLIGLSFLLVLAYGKYQQRNAPGYYGALTADKDGNDQYHVIGNFDLVDQTNEIVTLDRVENKVYVTNFFFASCPSICPTMMGQLKRVSDIYQNEKDFHILSFTVDPKRDTAEALKLFGEQYGVNSNNWSLLTGEKKEIYQLARTSFLVVADEGDGGPTDFIHSEKLVLVDNENHIRGYYDGTKPEEVNKLITDIRFLTRSKK